MFEQLGFGGVAGGGVRQRISRPGQSALPFHSLPLHSLGRSAGSTSPRSHRLLSASQRLRIFREKLHALFTWPRVLSLLGLAVSAVSLLTWATFAHILPASWGCGTIPFVSGPNCWWLAPKDVHRHFVYIYELPRSFHRDLLDRVTSHRKAQYQVDGLLFSFLQRSNAMRTPNPENASLFLVPVLPTLYLTLLHSQQLHLSLRHANGTTGALADIQETGRYVENALQYIQAKHPYWRRSNGRDHFIFTSNEYGRCGVLPFVSPKVAGDLFTLQPCGFADLHMASLLEPGSRLLSATRRGRRVLLPGLPPAIKASSCYKAGEDLVLPPLHASAPVVSPKQGHRTTLLLVFLGTAVAGTGAAPGAAQHNPFHGFVKQQQHPPPPSPPPPVGRPSVLYDRYSVRAAIEEMSNKEPGTPNGWKVFHGTLQETTTEMQQATMCVCLPDASYWLELLCMTQAVLSGCVPVTFFHDHLHPWLATFRFSDFTLNIDPMDVFEMKTRVEVMQLDAPVLVHMQEQLVRVQSRFKYTEPLPNNTFTLLVDLLQNKANNLLYGTPLYEAQ